MKRIFPTILLILLAKTVSAATYYVATTGNDSNSCSTAQTITTPKHTLNSAVGCLLAGDTLFVRAGTYDESIEGSAFTGSGTNWTNKIRIANYASEIVWLKPTGTQNYIL